MKNIIRLLIISAVGYFLLPSCEDMMGDYLDKAPGVDVTEDTIFSSRVQVETYIAGTYRYGIHSILPMRENNYTGIYTCPSAGCTDESESAVTYVDSEKYNAGNLTSESGSAGTENRLEIRWKAIRRCNILLERIDEVPGVDQTYTDQVKGEARFIRALNYFEMFKRYGGMPIVDKKFELTDEFKVPRNTVKEVVDFIVSDCDAAIPLLPDVYSTDMRGRATKGAALMLKAKTLLYAASPLFNTATPYLSMDDPSNNKLICYGDYDANRWRLAADAAKAVLDWAPSGGIVLITDKGTDKNYRYMAEVCDNPEIILACKMQEKVSTGSFPWTQLLPQNFYPNWNMGNSMTLNFMKKYEKKDGTSQTWNMNGGTDLTQKYNELDRRFKQTVTVVGDYWNPDYPVMNSHQGGTNASNCEGGQWYTKFIPSSLNRNSPAMANDILFRLGEAYLDYAEALNEAQGPVAAAYAAVNTIRARSGQPDLPAGLSQAEFRERVRNERAIELVFEDHRLWDINRWLIAEEEGVMQGNMYGIKTYLNPAAPNFRYETYVFEIRTFRKRMYLHPIWRSEMLKGYLVQNPGY
ncbi:MAG: RagB/SusD family nutrient uptake outer membrane protein [Mangrovibacterium sp.]